MTYDDQSLIHCLSVIITAAEMSAGAFLLDSYYVAFEMECNSGTLALFLTGVREVGISFIYMICSLRNCIPSSLS